jgi:hypothetical protein
MDFAQSLGEIGCRTGEHYEMAGFVSLWQGFGGVADFVSGMCRQKLSIAVLKLTHRSASHKKRPHVLTLIGRQQVWPLVTVHVKSGFLALVHCIVTVTN